ncbi:MAG: 2-oxo acid dehydrogenase subunit E2 [Oscillospiraceae bacterium]|nr:2-oxo acid dehydrogenase subunit E2 [Oscillospiraceae bacterium]
MPQEREKHRRDRKDAWYVGGLDPMHQFMPYLLPQRIANEAVLTELVPIETLESYVAKKNEASPDFHYSFFHIICAAIAKTLVLRPKMNYFIAGRRYYEKKAIQLAFVVRRNFEDGSEEALAVIDLDRDSQLSPVEQIHERVAKFVNAVRKEGATDNANNTMGVLAKLPRWLLKIFAWAINKLEYYGRLPDFLIEGDPYHASVFISNLGSIKMNADYHHLADWGTNSFFVVVGEKGPHPFFDEKGKITMRDSLKVSFTIDERIADGLYFAKSIRIFRRLLEEPELLERPANDMLEDIEF